VIKAPAATPAVPPPSAERTPAIDIIKFRSDLREADIEDVAESLLGTFLVDSRVRMGALEEAVAAQHPKAIESAAHAFKSGAGTIRANTLAQLLRDVEDAARRGRRELTVNMLEQVRIEYTAVRRQLATLLNGEN
jgi:HPt (histidine-containing phosphotransfer) domain-containing protein